MLAIACAGDDDEKSSGRTDASGDASGSGATGGSGGTGGSAASGGAAGNTSSVGGAGGAGGSGGTSTGGASGAPTGGVGGDGATAGAAGSAGADSGSAGAAGAGMDASADAADARPICARADSGIDGGGEWYDFAAGVCQPCPSDFDCNALLGPPGPSLDPGTDVMTLHLAPGTAEIVSGTWTFDYFVPADGGGQTRMTTSTAFDVQGNTLRTTGYSGFTEDLDQLYGIYSSEIILVDSCGTAHDIEVNGDGALEWSLEPTDAGPMIQWGCIFD